MKVFRRSGNTGMLSSVITNRGTGSWAIRQIGTDYTGKLPIVAMTANAFQDDVIHALESGMNGHVTKPIDMNVVCAVLEKWLGSAGRTEQEMEHGA